MKLNEILEELAIKYPTKLVFQNNDSDGNVTEVVCELDKSQRNSHAVAIIDRSMPHYHRIIEEKYKIIKGTLSLYIDDKNIVLNEGDEYTIDAGKKHYAIGNSTWVDVVATPAWNLEDHITFPVPFDTDYIPLTQQYYLCVPTCLQMIMLRHKINIMSSEEIGDQLGLVVPETEKRYFWNAKFGKPHNSGYGTNINKFPLNDFFQKNNIPMVHTFTPISTFKDLSDLSIQIISRRSMNESILVCYDWGTLFKDDNKHWGHVCLVDQLDKEFNLVRIIDPDPDQPKWKYIHLEDLYNAMRFHGDEKAGGLWVFKLTNTTNESTRI